MSVTDAISVQSERMNIHRRLPDVSRAMVALEREIKVDPVLRELVMAYLIRQIATINVWNRVSIATRASVGTYRA
jgi:hypothetical protein